MSSSMVSPYESARLKGQRVVLPKPNEVFLDIDTEVDWKLAWEMIRTMEENNLPLLITEVHPSKSGMPHRHVILEANRDFTPIERIAIQACLGSDRKRELLSLIRVMTGGPLPATVFFEPERT